MNQKIRLALTVVLALVLAVSGGYIVYKSLEYQRGEEEYVEAARAAGLPRRIETSAAPVVEPDPEQPPEEPGDPVVTTLDSVDLDALREVNDEVIGWIAIPDTDLSYPVLHRDNSWYLNHTWSGERNGGGAIFLERECAEDLSDFNTIIYGHRMNDTRMFGSLKFYKDLEYWQEHPSVYIVDDGVIYRYDVFSAYQVGVRGLTYRLHVDKQEDRQAFIDFCLEKSVIDTGIVPETDGQILTLSTCVGTSRSTNRWVVQAVLAERIDRERAE